MNAEELYLKATQLARQYRQAVGEKNDYYITLDQLMLLLDSPKANLT